MLRDPADMIGFFESLSIFTWLMIQLERLRRWRIAKWIDALVNEVTLGWMDSAFLAMSTIHHFTDNFARHRFRTQAGLQAASVGPVDGSASLGKVAKLKQASPFC